MKTFRIITTIVCGILGTFLASSQVDHSKLDKYVEKKMTRADFIGMQVGYIGKSGNTWYSSHGLLQAGQNKKVNDSTLFMIASSSKPVTALGILKLVDDKRIGLDDNINNYMPFKIANPHHPNEIITFRMLLAHTSSLIDNYDVLGPLYTTDVGGDSPLGIEEFVKKYFTPNALYYSKEKNFVDAKPGQHWQYSNMGVTLLGYLIEQITDTPFSEYMRREIFIPLQMNDSYWYLTEVPHANIASPHILPGKRNDLTSPKVLKHYGYGDVPAGQLRTTINDYLKFVKLLLNDGKVNGEAFIAKELIDEMFQIQFPKVNKHQAIAWNYDEFDNTLYYLLMPRLPSHTGVDPGVSSVVSIDMKKKIAAVAFLNSPAENFVGTKIFNMDIVRRLLKTAKKH
nr:serine hydrolase domain-containing protein [uncultured Allomuricauda sp.]